MFRFQAHGPRLCDGLNRRDALHVGGLGALGLSLPQLLAARSAEGATNGAGRGARRAKSCIILFLMGGPPQHSTWDPKPDAPAEVRGEIKPIDTNVPGIRFGELMPRLATHADKLAVVRAVSTGDNAHSSSGYYMLTGRPHQPMNRENANPGAPNDWPSMAAVAQQLLRPGGELPGAVRLPCHIFNTDGSVWPGQDAGFLGRDMNPWLFRCEPASPTYKIPEFTLPMDVSLERLGGRQTLLREFNRSLDGAARAGVIENYDRLTQRAFNLLGSPESRAAFDLSRESDDVRKRYGASQFGQSCLLARRLVEAGVRLVQVNWHRGPDEPSANPCWDSHAKETERLKTVLVPPMDHGFASLLEDLSQRGLLDDTLVVCMAEFGRTPRFNGAAGRDHWGPVFSIALAGGGVRGGVVHGASDAQGGQPKDGLVRPEDVTATIFHCLGLEPDATVVDPPGRRLSITSGQPIGQILS